MKGKDSGEAKGYAFVTFRSKELASKAIEKLNNSELKVNALLVPTDSSFAYYRCHYKLFCYLFVSSTFFLPFCFL